MDVVLDLARHAKAIGSDYIVVHAPVLHFLHKQDETLYEYYRYISEQVEIGIALWSHPDSGYLMSPELCARIADTAERRGDQVQRAAGDVRAADAARRRQVSWSARRPRRNGSTTSSSSAGSSISARRRPTRCRPRSTAACANTPTSPSRARWRAPRRSATVSNPVREAFRETRPPEKFHAHSKYWQELLGQAGGGVRRPLLELTEAEKDATRRAFESCGLKLDRVRSSAA